ncbi:hypothetical protein P280DRAFT_480962 [Massarina eburnea CBS 473.64]|uniref:F-box domain-containing protein n=1 Tax=Massarina eburnea CBS 473.64 TaxID=1395130 RepID=A0A6A6RVZ9_9PLEO|nr:hypothetical protein P280DRAFT_480962 [Massarina eburnea CBS 473.64]
MDREQPSRFLRLPTELRLMIYERIDCEVHYHSAGFPMTEPSRRISIVVRSVPTSLLLTCHQVHSEADKIMQKEIQTSIVDQQPEIQVRNLTPVSMQLNALDHVLDILMKTFNGTRDQVILQTFTLPYTPNAQHHLANLPQFHATALMKALESPRTKDMLRAISFHCRIKEETLTKFVQQTIRQLLRAHRPDIYIRGESVNDGAAIAAMCMTQFHETGVGIFYNQLKHKN